MSVMVGIYNIKWLAIANFGEKYLLVLENNILVCYNCKRNIMQGSADIASKFIKYSRKEHK